jgi:hypothetical protein
MPDQWTEAKSTFSQPDVFACKDDILSTHNDLNTQRCVPFPADDVAQMPEEQSRLVASAWCFKAPLRSTTLCFSSEAECARRVRIDPFAEGTCAWQDALTTLRSMFGSDQVR